MSLANKLPCIFVSVLVTTNTGKTRERFKHKQTNKQTKNDDDWTGKVEISQEKIPGNRRSTQGYFLTYSMLYRQNFLRSEF